MGLTISDAIRIGMINGKGEARREMGMSYTKAVSIPRTISESVDLFRNHKSYGLTAEELYQVKEQLNTK